jgi:hypothetical protein
MIVGGNSIRAVPPVFGDFSIGIAAQALTLILIAAREHAVVNLKSSSHLRQLRGGVLCKVSS